MAKDLDSLPKLYIRGQIAPKNSLFDLFGDGEETVSPSDVVKWLDEHKEDPEIVVEVSSDGGYKTAGLEIRSLLKNSGKIVHTVGYKVNSIATVVFLSNTEGGKRLVVEDPMDFVIHFARIDPMNLGTDALTAEDFQRLAEEVNRSDKQILDVYCDELGEEKRTELLASMSEERNLGARGAIKLGFANGYYKKKKKQKASVEDFRGVLIEDEIASIIINNMEKEKEKELQTKLTGMESVVNGLKKLVHKMFNGEIKNEITVVTDKGNIYLMPVNPDDPSNLVGAKAYQVDSDGMPLMESPAADGDYSAEGKIYVIKDGAVTEIKEAVDAKKLSEDLESEKAKSAALEAEVAELKTKLETQQTQFQTQVATIQNEFNSFKKLVPGDKKEKEDDDSRPPVDMSKMSMRERLQAMRRESGYGHKK